MNKNKLVVLGILAEQSMHGYQLDQTIKHRSMDMWAKINMASIYNTLITLEKEKLIKAVQVTVKKRSSK